MNARNTLLAISLVLLTSLVGFACPAAAAVELSKSYGRLPLQFEANQGQTDRQVRFLARGAGYSLYLTAGEAVLVLAKPNPDAKYDAKTHAKPTVLRMSLVNAAPAPRVSGLEELPGKANYFIGQDPAKWRTNVPTYAKVHYGEVYPGIDLVYYGNQRQLEYDFVVAPGADPKKIVLGFKGAERLEIDAQGDLVLHAARGDVRLRKPVIYQEIDGTRRDIEGGYVPRGVKQIGFNVAAYDRSRPLVIDPVLAYSTYLGGSGGDSGIRIALDAGGNAYVTGNTMSIDFPTTPGAFQLTFRGGGIFFGGDAFVTKLDPTGSTLVYSTFLGGSGFDRGYGIVVDADGHAYVTGYTASVDFPTTVGALQTTSGGSSDAFITKLNPTGSALVYSTYLGGSGGDASYGGIAVDAAGNAYVAGTTESLNFPTTPGAFQLARGCCGGDAFVAKLNPTGSGLVYSTYLGGGNSDGANGIAVDAAGNAYVAGATLSINFPSTAGAFQPICGGGGAWDAFVTKLNPTGSALVYSTFLGGGRSDGAGGIAVDADGNAYVTGSTDSSNFPTTAGAFQTTFVERYLGGGHFANDAFVTKLNPTGSALVYSTYLGGGGSDLGLGIAVDAAGNAHVTGYTDSIDFPTTAGAFQTTLGGSLDAFVTKLNPTGSALAYSTYLGGSGYDYGSGVAVDTAGNAYAIGETASSNFPTTAGAFQTTFGGGGDYYVSDAFVAKIVDDRTAPSTTASANPAPNAAGWNNSSVTVTLNAADNEGGSGVQSITYRINGDAPSTVSGATASFTLSLEGLNTITFNATDNAGNAEASKTAVVRIDQTPPSGTLSLSPSQLWPANHELVTIAPSLTVSDAGGGQVTVSGPLISSSEPETGPGDNTAPDWVLSGETLQLRAEHAQGGSGRVYTVTYTLTDQAGNSAQASSTVTVPVKR
jgi:hypothetical protein